MASSRERFHPKGVKDTNISGVNGFGGVFRDIFFQTETSKNVFHYTSTEFNLLVQVLIDYARRPLQETRALLLRRFITIVQTVAGNSYYSCYTFVGCHEIFSTRLAP